jgi:hypothetical protein
VQETENGGASKVEITGAPCQFKEADIIQPPTAEDDADIAPPDGDGDHEPCQVTVTNTFEPPPSPPSPAVPAAAVDGAPTFTA